MNRIAFVLDTSGSMSYEIGNLVKMFNANLKQVNPNDRVTVITFDTEIRNIVLNEKASEVRPLTVNDLGRLGPATNLYGGVKRAIEIISGADSHVVITLTDGGENVYEITTDDFSKLINKKQNTDKWTFAFLMPSCYVSGFKNIHPDIPHGNIRSWGTIKEAESAVNTGIGAYYTARSIGVTSVSNFFQPDLSNVKKTDLKSLDDVTNEVKIWENKTKEIDIATFVKNRTRREFKKGTAAYLLQKKEREVQDDKEVFLREIKTGKVYRGGRSVLGLPTFGSVKIEPGNHAGFEIYIQSKSDNRKIPRGSKVMFIGNLVKV